MVLPKLHFNTFVFFSCLMVIQSKNKMWFLVLACSLCIGCEVAQPTKSAAADETRVREELLYRGLIPLPQLMEKKIGRFVITPETRIVVDVHSPDMKHNAQTLAENIQRHTGMILPISSSSQYSGRDNIVLSLGGRIETMNDEEYFIDVNDTAVIVEALTPLGIYRGIHTVAQLISFIPPADIARDTLWGIPGIAIRDYPRYAWRGAMLDVARHFFTLDDIKKFIDIMPFYKLNRLHLHLTDDQGWRIEILSRPKLTEIGGTTQVGGERGKFFYTQSEYQDLVEYASKKFIAIVPEIDMPGHSTAALASYPELNCSGTAPAVYTGIGVGLPGVCVTKDSVLSFIRDVMREIAMMTPGEYLHIGGDESTETSEGYVAFVDSVQSIVQEYGKSVIGWEEIGRATLSTSTVMQYWNSAVNMDAVHSGVKVILSPSKKIYLDMQYTTSSSLGQNWAGYIEVQKAYEWDPVTEIPGLTENHILGVEAPLWTEKIFTLKDIEYMAFPRLIGLAEIGWSSATSRQWEEYKVRLGDHADHLRKRNVNFYPSPQVPWH